MRSQKSSVPIDYKMLSDAIAESQDCVSPREMAVRLNCRLPVLADGPANLANPIQRVRIVGQSPLAATVYELDRLRCNLCGEVFTARNRKTWVPKNTGFQQPLRRVGR